MANPFVPPPPLRSFTHAIPGTLRIETTETHKHTRIIFSVTLTILNLQLTVWQFVDGRAERAEVGVAHCLSGRYALFGFVLKKISFFMIKSKMSVLKNSLRGTWAGGQRRRGQDGVQAGAGAILACAPRGRCASRTALPPEAADPASELSAPAPLLPWRRGTAADHYPSHRKYNQHP